MEENINIKLSLFDVLFSFSILKKGTKRVLSYPVYHYKQSGWFSMENKSIVCLSHGIAHNIEQQFGWFAICASGCLRKMFSQCIVGKSWYEESANINKCIK